MARIGGRPMAANDKRDELEIDVQNASSREGIPRAESLRRWVRHALGGGRAVALTVRIVDETEGADLNERYRHGQGATNVLAFPSENDYLEYACLGDLVLCVAVVMNEARQQAKTLEQHWAHMVVHGMLHLQGYSHDEEAGAEKMEALEVKILSTLGYSNPYND